MINLQSNYPVLAEQEAAWPGMLREGVERFGAESLRLPAFGGSLHNRELAAAWLKMPVERTWICTSGHHGTLAALMAAGLAGKTIAVETLTYPWFMLQAQMLGMRVVPVAMDGEGLLPEALRRVCEREDVAADLGIKALYTMPTHHNPTCATASAERRIAVVEVVREFGLMIVEDSAYGFLADEEPPRYTELAPECAFYVESLSKRVVPGLRTCFVLAPESLGERMGLALRVMASGSSTLLTSMGCAMAADGYLARVIAEKRAAGRVRSAEAMKLLEGLEVVGGRNSWHLWVTLPEGWSAEAVEKKCEEQGVLVTGGQWFAAPGTLVPDAVRLGLGGEVEAERAMEGVRVFAEVVREASRGGAGLVHPTHPR